MQTCKEKSRWIYVYNDLPRKIFEQDIIHGFEKFKWHKFQYKISFLKGINAMITAGS